MSRRMLLALLFGLLLVTAPLVRAEEEEYDEADDADDDDDDDGDDGDKATKMDEKDVVVITKDNWEDKIKKSKFALVRFGLQWMSIVPVDQNRMGAGGCMGSAWLGSAGQRACDG
jgi:hypothetical protein